MNSSASRSRPVVLVAACLTNVDGHAAYITRRPYLDALRLAGCQPLLVPGAGADEVDALLDLADGVLLTGSPSNVHASHYGEAVLDESLPQDAGRDAWSLPMIRRAIARGVPILGICRGSQEMNVALGGSLHQAVHEVPGMADHQPTVAEVLSSRYGPAHTVAIVSGGLLDSLLGAPSIMVNSVHGQGVKRLGEGLRAEALAPDGLVEAFTDPAGKGFNLAVQWHPEWLAAENPVSVKIFGAFGDACRRYQG
ncbi:gamma-glutamyl-gamma-aminobutyrate hydrolase family protein [Luteolibacter sp. Populi]|uniref:gamma-glutamyl-gamma-aminobutyrate hydrolase family protein n=1 Tax=Luteolibacter sp. Populi TaxID=3230487 RepID=UPI003467D620